MGESGGNWLGWLGLFYYEVTSCQGLPSTDYGLQTTADDGLRVTELEIE